MYEHDVQLKGPDHNNDLAWFLLEFRVSAIR